MRLRDVEYSLQKYLQGFGFRWDNGGDQDTGLSITLVGFRRVEKTVSDGREEYIATYAVTGTAQSKNEMLDLLSDYMDAPLTTKGLTVYNVDSGQEVQTEECAVVIDGNATVDPVDQKSFTDGLTVDIIC